ncbi:MAG TPA: MFS transporter [Dictyobacter sp.]|jgi:MFS family permease|nr:MFS transporter [Dictyobacter sp.]
MDVPDKPLLSSPDMPKPGTHLWHNAHFNTFWLGQTLSALGDSFATIAIPLLVLQATGSVAYMGLVTGTFTVGQIIAGIFAGAIADRIDRRKLMIFCDVMRTILYFSIPLGWWIIGPQLWLIFLVVALGSCLGMTFAVTYMTAIPNLVDKDQITEANSRLQTTYAIAYILGPVLAGLVSGRFGSTAAISIDATSFAISAISLSIIRLRPNTRTSQEQLALKQEKQHSNVGQEFLAGLRFLWQNPILRPVMLLLSLLTLLTTGAIDLFIFHLKHDLAQSDDVVGIIFGLASVGGILGGLLLPLLRKTLGFGPCWIGGWILAGISIVLIAITPNLYFCSALTIVFIFATTVANISSMTLRQQITPDHILGRVTSVFWTINTAPGPFGAAFFTALSGHIGTSPVLMLIGVASILVMLTGLFTPARQRFPERAYSHS